MTKHLGAETLRVQDSLLTVAVAAVPQVASKLRGRADGTSAKRFGAPPTDDAEPSEPSKARQGESEPMDALAGLKPQEASQATSAHVEADD